VFPARYELNSYIVFRKRLVSKRLNVGMICSRVLISTSSFDGDFIYNHSAETVTQICD
jgi:hypothetical protein